ncbi:MAG: hypothetical protein AAB601_03425, partial [Patescibacteria group bacterium]
MGRVAGELVAFKKEIEGEAPVEEPNIRKSSTLETPLSEIEATIAAAEDPDRYISLTLATLDQYRKELENLKQELKGIEVEPGLMDLSDRAWVLYQNALNLETPSGLTTLASFDKRKAELAAELRTSVHNFLMDGVFEKRAAVKRASHEAPETRPVMSEVAPPEVPVVAEEEEKLEKVTAPEIVPSATPETLKEVPVEEPKRIPEEPVQVLRARRFMEEQALSEDERARRKEPVQVRRAREFMEEQAREREKARETGTEKQTEDQKKEAEKGKESEQKEAATGTFEKRRGAYIDAYREYLRTSKKKKEEREAKKKAAEAEYAKYVEAQGTAVEEAYDAKKKELEGKKLTKEAMEAELKAFTAQEIVKKYLIEEAALVERERVESAPLKEKGILRKGLERWNRMPKWVRWGISA